MPDSRGRYTLLAQILHVRHVADALRHLRAVSEQELAVHPDARERLSRRRFGLRDLILVMREHEIHATAMQVEGLAQILHRHRRALEVPTWATASPRRIPGSTGDFVLGLRRFP